MRPSRRSDVEIVAAILEAIHVEEGRAISEPKPTHVQARVYLSWNAFTTRMRWLRENDFVTGYGLHVTDKGEAFLRAYRTQVRTVLEKFGLEHREPLADK